MSAHELIKLEYRWKPKHLQCSVRCAVCIVQLCSLGLNVSCHGHQTDPGALSNWFQRRTQTQSFNISALLWPNDQPGKCGNSQEEMGDSEELGKEIIDENHAAPWL